LSFVVVCGIQLSQSPLLSLSSCGSDDFATYLVTEFSREKCARLFNERRTDVTSFSFPLRTFTSNATDITSFSFQLRCPTQVSTCSSHKRGSLFKVCYQFSGSLNWPGRPERYYSANSSQAWRSSQGPRKAGFS